MAVLTADPLRRRLRLSPAALATAALLLSGPLSDDRLAEAVGPEVAELEAIGIVFNGELVPWAARHLLVMLAPDLHVESAVNDSAGEVITRFWARAEHAIVGRSVGAGWVDLVPTEAGLLAWTLAAAVGLASRGAAPIPMRQPIDLARLSRFEEALAQGDHRRAGEVVGDGRGLGAQELAVMAALASPDRAAWRITATWTAGCRPLARSLSVVDAGSFGLWCSEGDPERVRSPGHAVRLHPTSTADVWHRLVSILSPGTSSCPDPSADDDQVTRGRTPCPTPVPPSLTAP